MSTNNKEQNLKSFKETFPGIPTIDLSSIPVEEQSNVLETAFTVLEGPKFMNRDRPYIGQPWTDKGIRGSVEVVGLTFRDIRDCFVRAYILSHDYHVYDREKGCHTLERQEPNATLIDEANKGEKAQLNGNDLYGLVGSIDPIAVSQNLSCEMERMMGIFPNVPRKETDNDPTIKLITGM